MRTSGGSLLAISLSYGGPTNDEPSEKEFVDKEWPEACLRRKAKPE